MSRNSCWRVFECEFIAFQPIFSELISLSTFMRTCVRFLRHTHQYIHSHQYHQMLIAPKVYAYNYLLIPFVVVIFYFFFLQYRLSTLSVVFLFSLAPAAARPTRVVARLLACLVRRLSIYSVR